MKTKSKPSTNRALKTLAGLGLAGGIGLGLAGPAAAAGNLNLDGDLAWVVDHASGSSAGLCVKDNTANNQNAYIDYTYNGSPVNRRYDAFGGLANCVTYRSGTLLKYKLCRVVNNWTDPCTSWVSVRV